MAATDSSFDIVSKVDLPELENALNQARKEVDNRFDFKGTGRVSPAVDARSSGNPTRQARGPTQGDILGDGD